MGTGRGCVRSRGRRSLPGRVSGGSAGPGSAEKWGEAAVQGRGKYAPPSTPAAKMATSRALACGARGLRTQEAGAKCIAGQSPRGCEAVVMGMPSLGGRGLVGAGQSRLVRAGAPAPGRPQRLPHPRGQGAGALLGVASPARLGDGPLTALCCQRLQSHLLLQKERSCPGPHAALLAVGTSSKEGGGRRADGVCPGSRASGEARSQIQRRLTSVHGAAGAEPGC